MLLDSLGFALGRPPRWSARTLNSSHTHFRVRPSDDFHTTLPHAQPRSPSPLQYSPRRSRSKTARSLPPTLGWPVSQSETGAINMLRTITRQRLDIAPSFYPSITITSSLKSMVFRNMKSEYLLLGSWYVYINCYSTKCIFVLFDKLYPVFENAARVRLVLRNNLLLRFTCFIVCWATR